MSLYDLAVASDSIDGSLVSYVKAILMYNGGEPPEGDGNRKTWADVMGEGNFNGVLNYSSIPVDAVADRLQLLTIKGPTDAVTEQISEWWTANKMQLRFNGQFIHGVLTYGDYYMCVWPELLDDELDLADSEEEDVDPTLLNHKAKITFADPETTRAFYDEGGELQYVARKWMVKDDSGKALTRVNLYYKDRIEKYFWREDQKPDQAEPFFVAGEEWPLENPYGQIPFFHFSNGLPYGTPEHKNMYGIQDAMNEIFRIHINSIKFLGFPTVYALLDETSATGTSDFEYAPIDQNESDIADINRLKNEPGSVWAMRAKSIGQLEPAGSGSFIDSLKMYKEMASEVTGLPARMFSSTDGQHPGADAVNAADAVLNQRVIDRSVVVSETLKQMIAFGMKLAFGLDLTADEISIQWRPQRAAYDASSIPIFQFKLTLGVPEEQVLSEMGYTPAEIAMWAENINSKRQMAKDAAEAGMINAAKAKTTAGNTSDNKTEDTKQDKNSTTEDK